MSRSTHRFVRLPFLLIISMLLAIPSVFAQAPVAVKAKAKKPSFDSLPSPDFGGNTNLKRFKEKWWLEIEVEFEVDARVGRDTPNFIDELEFRYYVAVENGERSRENPAEILVIEKIVRHVNIPVGESIYSSVYLSPSSVQRITGSRSSGRASKSTVKEVTVQIFHNGQTVGGSTTTGRMSDDGRMQDPWWTKLGSGKMMRTEAIPLLPKDETPFAPMWWDRYAEPKIERR